jgi:hypothetical protein
MHREICPSRVSGDGQASFSGLVAKRMESLLMEKWQYDAEFPDHVKTLSHPDMRHIAAGAVVEELCTPLSMCDCLDAIDPDTECSIDK